MATSAANKVTIGSSTGDGANATVALVYSSASLPAAQEVAALLEQQSFAISPRPITRTLVVELSRERPDAVVIVHVAGTFDVTRLCRDVAETVDRGTLVVLAEPLDGSSGDAEALEISILDAGADDVVARTASATVLAARLRAVVRNRPPSRRQTTPIVLGDLEIDADAYLVRIAGEPVKIRPLHFQLLTVLARHAEAAVGGDQLLREVWGVRPGDVDPRRLRIAISRLRQILGSADNRPQIESVARFGYRLTKPSTV